MLWEKALHWLFHPIAHWPLPPPSELRILMEVGARLDGPLGPLSLPILVEIWLWGTWTGTFWKKNMSTKGWIKNGIHEQAFMIYLWLIRDSVVEWMFIGASARRDFKSLWVEQKELHQHRKQIITSCLQGKIFKPRAETLTWFTKLPTMTTKQCDKMIWKSGFNFWTSGFNLASNRVLQNIVSCDNPKQWIFC